MHHLERDGGEAKGPGTRGVTIRWARLCDHVTSLLLVGQEPALRAMTVDLAGVQPGDRVLEVGCGTGSLALAAARRAGATGKIYVIDPDRVMIGVTIHKAGKQRFDVTFQVGLIEVLPFSDRAAETGHN